MIYLSKKLMLYRQKRNFKKTKEPVGKLEKSNKKLKFVVQHHMARKEHYDLRLEWKGTLKSWAIPKGPSYNPKDKRLAVFVEDHPLSYRNFEGTIPKGQYGGGTVMVWDEGYWEPIEGVDGNFATSVKFVLHGKRLKGKWSLVPYKWENWLLIKEKDSYYQFSSICEYETSVKTGRTMDEIALGIHKKKRRNSKKDHIVETVEISNPDKIIVPRPKITKMDIALYYQKVAKRMLPFVENRVLSTIRCPSGVNGICFFKKHLEQKNESLGCITIPNNKNKKEDYYYIKDLEGIFSEVQMNGFEFHVWGSVVGNLNSPDVMVFDLDPDESISLTKIRQGVKDLKSILDEFSLPSFLKTSGGKGYHVVVPIKKLKNWEKFRWFSNNIAKLMEARWPEKYTSNIRKEKRKGKIFIDWIRNTKGATSVAPYSLRMRKKVRVSMPISWDELDQVKPDGITMEEAIKRLRKKDPWSNFFSS